MPTRCSPDSAAAWGFVDSAGAEVGHLGLLDGAPHLFDGVDVVGELAHMNDSQCSELLTALMLSIDTPPSVT